MRMYCISKVWFLIVKFKFEIVVQHSGERHSGTSLLAPISASESRYVSLSRFVLHISTGGKPALSFLYAHSKYCSGQSEIEHSNGLPLV